MTGEKKATGTPRGEEETKARVARAVTGVLEAAWRGDRPARDRAAEDLKTVVRTLVAEGTLDPGRAARLGGRIAASLARVGWEGELRRLAGAEPLAVLAAADGKAPSGPERLGDAVRTIAIDALSAALARAEEEDAGADLATRAAVWSGLAAGVVALAGGRPLPRGIAESLPEPLGRVLRLAAARRMSARSRPAVLCRAFARLALDDPGEAVVAALGDAARGDLAWADFIRLAGRAATRPAEAPEIAGLRRSLWRALWDEAAGPAGDLDLPPDLADPALCEAANAALAEFDLRLAGGGDPWTLSAEIRNRIGREGNKDRAASPTGST